MTENKPTRKSRNVMITIPDRYMDEARFVMKELEISTFSALVRELIDEMYFYLTSEEWKNRNEEGKNDAL